MEYEWIKMSSIVHIIQKYEIEFMNNIKSIDDISKKLKSLNFKLKDDWNKNYIIDFDKRYIFSSGPDGIHDFNDEKSYVNLDNIIIYFDMNNNSPSQRVPR